MPEYLSPGVYIEEVASGPVPIAGVSTSTGAMIGFAQRGPTDAPTLLTSTGDFSRIFGGPLPPGAAPNLNAGFNALAYAAEGFFQNGGTRLYATTWYQHHMWPARYWRAWSDYIIHRLHDMVLANIRERAEAYK